MVGWLLGFFCFLGVFVVVVLVFCCCWLFFFSVMTFHTCLTGPELSALVAIEGQNHFPASSNHVSRG